MSTPDLGLALVFFIPVLGYLAQVISVLGINPKDIDDYNQNVNKWIQGQKVEILSKIISAANPNPNSQGQNIGVTRDLLVTICQKQERLDEINKFRLSCVKFLKIYKWSLALLVVINIVLVILVYTPTGFIATHIKANAYYIAYSEIVIITFDCILLFLKKEKLKSEYEKEYL